MSFVVEEKEASHRLLWVMDTLLNAQENEP